VEITTTTIIVTTFAVVSVAPGTLVLLVSPSLLPTTGTEDLDSTGNDSSQHARCEMAHSSIRDNNSGLRQAKAFLCFSGIIGPGSKNEFCVGI